VTVTATVLSHHDHCAGPLRPGLGSLPLSPQAAPSQWPGPGIMMAPWSPMIWRLVTQARDSDTRRFAPGPRAGCQCRAAGRHFKFVDRNRTATSEPLPVSFIQARCRDRDATARLPASLTE
jgi:hypothetical protein